MELTSDDILKAIAESGYLFEQEVATKIEQNNYHIVTNSAFTDLDEEKSREIDVTGFKRFYHDENLRISVGVRILCECKNNKNPFVFITRNKGSVDKDYCPPNFSFPKDKFEVLINENPKTYNEIKAFKYYNIDSIFPYSKAEAKAVQFCKLVQKDKKWNAFHDGIYDSLLLPLSKCLEYYKKNDLRLRGQNWQYFTLYFPLIVLNSKIYYIDSHIDSTIVNETDFISFTRAIENKKQNETYLFDFITLHGIQKYIENHIEIVAKEFVEKVIRE